MPSVRYFNQTAPFWDFVANMEEQGSSHPLFGGNPRGEGAGNDQERPNPWTDGWSNFPWGTLPHRGRHGMHPPPPPPPPPPPQPEGPAPPPPAAGEGESDPEGNQSDERPEGAHACHGRHEHHHGRHGMGGRGRHGMGGRGGHWGRGRGAHFHPYAMGGFGGLAEMFQNQFFNDNSNESNQNQEFTPEVDVFDTTEAFIVHVSLPGAKKEDIAVNWNVEKSELGISGVVHRPGDEELLKTLSMNERKVGAFDRKVRLGSRANPAQVEVGAITARMEDGVLKVEVPKLDAGYVEVKKVDIE